jgi:hypothetical protein
MHSLPVSVVLRKTRVIVPGTIVIEKRRKRKRKIKLIKKRKKLRDKILHKQQLQQ